MSTWLSLALLLGTCLPSAALGHELRHSVGEGRAAFVAVSRADGRAFAGEGYEIFRGQETSPFQVGRTDVHGRLAFFPDRAGAWRVKVFSEDGHGLELALSTDEEGDLERREAPSLPGHLRILVGVCILFGLFGLVQLFWRTRSERG
jgi:nickel transport protein